MYTVREAEGEHRRVPVDLAFDTAEHFGPAGARLTGAFVWSAAAMLYVGMALDVRCNAGTARRPVRALAVVKEIAPGGVVRWEATVFEPCAPRAGVLR